MEGLTIIGPAKASISKINDNYRFVIYCKHKEYQKLVTLKDRVEAFLEKIEHKNESVQFDFDPMDNF